MDPAVSPLTIGWPGSLRLLADAQGVAEGVAGVVPQQLGAEFGVGGILRAPRLVSGHQAGESVAAVPPGLERFDA
jgi:hypothetical protein